MIKNNKTVIRFIVLWLLTVTIGSIIVGCFSFFLPFDNIHEYQFSDFMEYEVIFLFRTILWFMLFSGFLAFFYIISGILLYRRIVNSNKYQLVKPVMIIVNILFVLLPFLLWYLLGYSLSKDYLIYVLPSYLICSLLFSLLLIPRLHKNS